MFVCFSHGWCCNDAHHILLWTVQSTNTDNKEKKSPNNAFVYVGWLPCRQGSSGCVGWCIGCIAPSWSATMMQPHGDDEQPGMAAGDGVQLQSMVTASSPHDKRAAAVVAVAEAAAAAAAAVARGRSSQQRVHRPAAASATSSSAYRDDGSGGEAVDFSDAVLGHRMRGGRLDVSRKLEIVPTLSPVSCLSLAPLNERYLLVGGE